jgi:hypothetical protein
MADPLAGLTGSVSAPGKPAKLPGRPPPNKAQAQAKLAGPPLKAGLGPPGMTRAPSLPVPAPSRGLGRSQGVGRVPVPSKGPNPFAGIPKPFEGAPKLQKAETAKPTSFVRPMSKQAIEGMSGLPRTNKPSSGGGGGLLATIESPARLGAAIATDIPKELKGTGVVEKGLRSAAGTFGAVEQKGYENILGKAGKGVAEVIGNTGRDIVELPAQILPTLYVGGKIGVKGLLHPGGPSKTEHAEIEKLIHSYTHESALGNLASGNLSGALSAAKRNPLYAGLEASGVAAVADRAAGAAARAGAMGPDLAQATKLADAGATNVSRAPANPLGNVQIAQRPYSKRLSVRLAQNKPKGRPGESIRETLTPGGGLSKQLVKQYDHAASTLENVRRNSRATVEDARMRAVKGKPIKGAPLTVPVPGHRAAVNLFARGILADPKVIDPATGQPLYRSQLSGLVTYHAKPVEGELPSQAQNRMAKVVDAQAALDDSRLQQHPELAHAAAVKYAQDLKKLEPDIIRHEIVANPQSLKIAKLADPFQFHWRGQDPQFDTNPILMSTGKQYLAYSREREDALAARRGSLVEKRRAEAAGDKRAVAEIQSRHQANLVAHKASVAKLQSVTPPDPTGLHESPFSIAAPRKPGQAPTGERIYLSPEQVERELWARHGVDPNNIGFVSNRPFVNDARAHNIPNAEPTKGGFNPQKQRTGTAFAHGQYDTSYDALVRQHLTNQGLVDQARGFKSQVKTFALSKEHLAQLLEEKAGQLPAHEQVPIKALIGELRSGGTFFEPHGNTAAWDHAMRAIKEVERLHPRLKLTPGRIAHPFTPGKTLNAIAKHMIGEDVQGRLDPNVWAAEHGLETFPKDSTLERQFGAGPIGVYHKAVADRMAQYERDTGNKNAALLRAPMSWWRRANIAFSTKHIFGLMQELGLRAGVNNIGPLSLLRAHRLMNLVERAAGDPQFLKDHPEAALDAQRLQAAAGGTIAYQTQNLQRHVSVDALPTSYPAAVARAFRAGSQQKLAGAPLRAVKSVLGAYSGTASKILSVERKALERPAQLAGFGKHVNNEAKRIYGKSLPVFGAVTDVEKKMAEGMLDQKAVDHASRQMVEYWGDWTHASPTTKKILAVAPFWNWYRNSLRFLYLTLPAHHPIKTALLTTLENATAEQRRAMGQGHGASEKLEPEQQGGFPIGGGWIANQQYYTPQGAVAAPAETVTSLLLPEFSDAYKALTGTNPFGQTLTNAKKEPITDEGERIKLAAMSLLETFNPPLRQALTIAQGGKSAQTGSALWDVKTKGAVKEDPIGSALGIPAGLYNAFRPFKTTQERTEKGERRSPASSISGLRKESLRKEGPIRKEGPLRKEVIRKEP